MFKYQLDESVMENSTFRTGELASDDIMDYQNDANEYLPFFDHYVLDCVYMLEYMKDDDDEHIVEEREHPLHHARRNR